MKKDWDAFGREILDHMNGQEVTEIVERDDGFIDTSGGPKTYFAPYRAWMDCERDAIRSARGRVLDIGCGAGRVSLHLQEKGHDVLAVDVSPLAVKVARTRGVRNARVASAAAVSRRLGTFDTIVMYGNNFGLFENPVRARWMLRRFHAMTSPDARLIVQSLDPYDTTAEHHRAYHRRNRERGRMGGQVRIRVRYKVYATPWFDYLLVSRKEMREVLEGTGWRVSRFAGDGAIYCAVIEKCRVSGD
jgi:SAM-dependent methyltransferase